MFASWVTGCQTIKLDIWQINGAELFSQTPFLTQNSQFIQDWIVPLYGTSQKFNDLWGPSNSLLSMSYVLTHQYVCKFSRFVVKLFKSNQFLAMCFQSSPYLPVENKLQYLSCRVSEYHLLKRTKSLLLYYVQNVRGIITEYVADFHLQKRQQFCQMNNRFKSKQTRPWCANGAFSGSLGSCRHHFQTRWEGPSERPLQLSEDTFWYT